MAGVDQRFPQYAQLIGGWRAWVGHRLSLKTGWVAGGPDGALFFGRVTRPEAQLGKQEAATEALEQFQCQIARTLSLSSSFQRIYLDSCGTPNYIGSYHVTPRGNPNTWTIRSPTRSYTRITVWAL